MLKRMTRLVTPLPARGSVHRGSSRLLTATVVFLCGCRPAPPGTDGNAEAEHGPDLGSPDGCSDGEARPGEFCFHPIPIVDDAPLLRRTTVASTMADGGAEIIILHSIAGPSKIKIIRLQHGSKTATVSATLDNGVSGHRLFLVDLDGDGDKDLLEASYSSTFGVFWREDQAFTDIQQIDLNLEGLGHVLPIDLDADGVPELLKAHQSYGEIGGRAEIFHHADTGWEPSEQEIEVPGCGSLGANGGVLALASDLNGDGAEDLILAGDPVYSGEQLDCEQDSGRHDVVVRIANPNTGQLGEPVIVLADQRSAGVYVGDLDGDGHRDVAIAPHEGGPISLARGSGEDFSAPITLDLTLGPGVSVFELPMLADLDGDGRQEFCESTSDGLAIHLLGEESPVSVSFGAPVAHLENLGDLNEDGIDDFIGDLGEDGPRIFLSNP